MKVKFSSWLILSLFAALALLGLQGCGGGGGSASPADAKPTGYYDNTGTASIDDNGAGAGATALSDLQAMINDKRIMMISDTEDLFYDGTITSISGNDFAANVSVFKRGQPISSPSATISGTITEKSKITGTLTGTGAGNGTFTLQYAANNNQLADVTRINQNTTTTWAAKLGGSTGLTTFDLTSGNISNPGASNNGFFIGCKISTGSFTPITGTSLYNVTMVVTSCTTNPSASLTYSGLATSWSKNNTDDRLAVGVTDTNSTYSIDANFLPF